MLSQEIIDNAILGNEDALMQVRNHFLPYIKSICSERVVIGDRTEYAVNKEMEGEIITHLFLAILKLKEE